MAVTSPNVAVGVLLGVYLGVLTGIVPALVTWALALLFRYVTGITVPALGIVVLAVAIAGVNGGFLALVDPTIVQSANSVTVMTAVLVVMMISFYAHSRGDRLGASLPRALSLSALRDRSLSTDVVERVGGRRQVRLRVVGAVGDMEGYPPLPESVRNEIRESDWTFPADLPLTELEGRFADRLRTEYDLADVSVSIDEQARATVTAAPPLSGLSGRIPEGTRAVSVSALVPTGIARGDEVAVHTDEGSVAGTVVSARSDGPGVQSEDGASDDAAEAGDESETHAQTPAATTGGEGRVTVAVDRDAATTLLRAAAGRVVVTARGTRREFELVSLLRRGGQRIRRLTLAADGPLDGTTIGEADVRDRYDVAVLAVRNDGEWTFAPTGDAALLGGDELFAVGMTDALDRFRGEGAVE